MSEGPSHSQVTVQKEETALRVAMNRPEKKNALTLAMYEALVGAFEHAAREDAIRSLIITGAPGVFTAGNDLQDFMKSPPTGVDSPVMRFLRALIEFEKPIIAAVDGPAVGVGTTMLLHCDLVLCTERARFSMPFTKLGLVPEAASSLLVPALFGRQRATEWLLLARPFDGKQAVAAGLASRLCAPEELDRAAAECAAEFATFPREATALTKRLIRQGTKDAVKAALEREGALFLERLGSPETMQAMMGFFAKRS
jgi:enoyl-CoA hydratase/carnithine racemase